MNTRYKRTSLLPQCHAALALAMTLMAFLLSLVWMPAQAQAEQLPKDALVYVESPQVSSGDVQRIAVVTGTGRQVSSANLFCHVDATAYSVPASAFSGDSALFEFPATLTGASELVSVSVRYADSQEELTYELASLASDSEKDVCSFVVAGAADDGVAALSLDDSADSTIVAADDSGTVHEYASVQDASAAISTQSTFSRTSNGPFVICLDPGHGPGESNPGSVSHGLKECNLTLSIAKYCKAALEKYPGVKVIMTHDGRTGTSDLQQSASR